MHRDGMTFANALKSLADIAGIQLEADRGKEATRRWEAQKRFEAAMAYAADYYHRTLLEHKGGLKYLESRGFTLETIKRLKLGFSDGNLVLSVKKASLEGFGIDDFVEAGLLKPSTKKPGTHYDYFDPRIIFPLLYRGRVLNLSGRQTDLSTREAKYLHLKNVDVDHFYNEQAIAKEVWLFEGHPDTVTAIQCDLPAVGVIGTGGMKHPEKLAGCQKIYICGDADRAGITAVDKWAQAILSHNATCEILFVTLTGGAKDFNEWYLANRGQGFAEKFRTMTEAAKNLIDFRIGHLTNSEQLVKVWPLINALPALQQDFYLNKVKAQLGGISIKLIRREFKEYQERQKLSERATLANAGNLDCQEFEETGAIKVNMFTRFEKNQALASICVYAPVTRTDEEGNTVRNREHALIQNTVNLETGESKPAGICLQDASPSDYDKKTIPMASIVERRWRSASMRNFLKGVSKSENTANLVRDITQYLRRYIWHSDESTHEVLALYAMGTYAARIFRAFPYLSLNGLAGSGKSNTLDLMYELCFNAVYTANISPSALFRTIESTFATCIRDEAEQFNKKTPENMDELTMLNAGYKAGAKVMRSGKNAQGQFDVEEFDLFSPKIFAGINMLNDTLLTRSILIKMYKAPKDVVKNMPRMVQSRDQLLSQGADLRDRLHVWFMTRFVDIKQVYDQYKPIDEIANRDWEVWLPLLAVAALADMEDTERAPDSEMLTERIIRTAIAKGKEKKEMSQDNTIHLKTLVTLLDLLNSEDTDLDNRLIPVLENPSWYQTLSVCKLVSAKLVEEGFFKDSKELTPRWLTQILTQCQVITDKESQFKKLWVPSERGQRRCIYLPKEVIEEALSRL
jgi:DNA primase catalytic core